MEDASFSATSFCPKCTEFEIRCRDYEREHLEYQRRIQFLENQVQSLQSKIKLSVDNLVGSLSPTTPSGSSNPANQESYISKCIIDNPSLIDNNLPEYEVSKPAKDGPSGFHVPGKNEGTHSNLSIQDDVISRASPVSTTKIEDHHISPAARKKVNLSELVRLMAQNSFTPNDLKALDFDIGKHDIELLVKLLTTFEIKDNRIMGLVILLKIRHPIIARGLAKTLVTVRPTIKPLLDKIFSSHISPLSATSSSIISSTPITTTTPPPPQSHINLTIVKKAKPIVLKPKPPITTLSSDMKMDEDIKGDEIENNNNHNLNSDNKDYRIIDLTANENLVPQTNQIVEKVQIPYDIKVTKESQQQQQQQTYSNNNIIINDSKTTEPPMSDPLQECKHLLNQLLEQVYSGDMVTSESINQLAHLSVTRLPPTTLYDQYICQTVWPLLPSPNDLTLSLAKRAFSLVISLLECIAQELLASSSSSSPVIANNIDSEDIHHELITLIRLELDRKLKMVK